jgi:hypothetical protein
VLLIRPAGRKDSAAIRELRDGLPFLDIAIVYAKRFEEYVTRLFATDRRGVPKGVVEIVI